MTLLLGINIGLSKRISRKRKIDSRCFFFSAKNRGSVKIYVELACVRELSKEATGVHLNGCVV
jgi:hypothetical protein